MEDWILFSQQSSFIREDALTELRQNIFPNYVVVVVEEDDIRN